MQILKSQSMLSNQQTYEKIQLFISCRNLSETIHTAVNSYVQVYMIQSNKPKKQIHKTKVYKNNPNPDYAQSILIDFVFEIKQKLTFQVYQQPNKLIGKLQSSVGEIFGGPNNQLLKNLTNNKDQKSGKIIIRCQKAASKVNKRVTFQLSANNLPSYKYWWFFGGTCSFFRIYRKRQHDDLLIYESQTINYNTSPKWKQFTLSERKLCKNDDSTNFYIKFYNFQQSGQHNLIGTLSCTLQKLTIQTKFKINENSTGQMVVNKMQRNRQYQFGDFISSGLQLALITCIDFTASNGNIKQPSSLHFSSSIKPTAYQQALKQVLNILLDYDYDKLVPGYGFGAKVFMPTFNTGGKVSHCFPLNGNVQNPDLFQAEGIIQAYKNTLNYVNLSGPTHFSGLMEVAIQQAKSIKPNNGEYMILFILTDGQIHDRAKVIDQLIECNNLPISIIIVGIGNGQFDIMKQLDDDNCQLVDSHGKPTTRDLVQFVQFKQFKNNSVQLARQVLFELPGQVSEYFLQQKIEPKDIKRKKILNDIEAQQYHLVQKQ